MEPGPFLRPRRGRKRGRLAAADRAPYEMPTVDPQHVQFPHLETFAKAAELRSFTAAAKALRVSQAAVSQRIRAMEGMPRQRYP